MTNLQLSLRVVFVALPLVLLSALVQADELRDQPNAPTASANQNTHRRSFTRIDEAKAMARQLGRPIMLVFR